MSADRQRLVSAIRRIATTDPEIRSLLDEAQSRGSQPASTGVGASDAESDRQCCDGSVSGNTNPGTNQRNPDDGGQEEGLDSDDPANLSMGEGSLTGVTDCATGYPICFDGDDWIPPDGWDSPTAPPLDDTYCEEVAYEVVYDNDRQGTTTTTYHRTARSAEIAYNSLICPGLSGVSIPTCGSASAAAVALDDNFTGDQCSGNSINTVTLSSIGCPNSSYPICSEEQPLEDFWEIDGCINLAVKRGTIVGSKYDPERNARHQGGLYSSPLTEIELCDANGNKIKLAPSADGGWKTIDAINPGDGYLYDSQGTQIARISDDEYSDPKV